MGSEFDHPEITGEGRVTRKLDAEMPPRDTIAKRVKEAGYDHALGLTWMDDGIGAILNKLDELGIADNTIFIFIPDHGSTKKASMFSLDGSNVPMVVRYPNGIKAGSVSDSSFKISILCRLSLIMPVLLHLRVIMLMVFQCVRYLRTLKPKFMTASFFNWVVRAQF